MSPSERQLLEDRANRDAARAVFDARLQRVRGALEERPIVSRVGDEALGRARTAATAASDIVRDERWIFALTGVAVAGWLLRRPLLRWGKAAWRRASTMEPPSLPRRLLEWIEQKVKS